MSVMITRALLPMGRVYLNRPDAGGGMPYGGETAATTDQSAPNAFDVNCRGMETLFQTMQQKTAALTERLRGSEQESAEAKMRAAKATERARAEAQESRRYREALQELRGMLGAQSGARFVELGKDGDAPAAPMSLCDAFARGFDDLTTVFGTDSAFYKVFSESCAAMRGALLLTTRLLDEAPPSSDAEALSTEALSPDAEPPVRTPDAIAPSSDEDAAASPPLLEDAAPSAPPLALPSDVRSGPSPSIDAVARATIFIRRPLRSFNNFLMALGHPTISFRNSNNDPKGATNRQVAQVIAYFRKECIERHVTVARYDEIHRQLMREPEEVFDMDFKKALKELTAHYLWHCDPDYKTRTPKKAT